MILDSLPLHAILLLEGVEWFFAEDIYPLRSMIDCSIEHVTLHGFS